MSNWDILSIGSHRDRGCVAGIRLLGACDHSYSLSDCYSRRGSLSDPRIHAHNLSPIKALATTHRLLRPTLSPLELAVKFVPEAKASAAGLRPVADPAEGVPVLN